MSYELSVSEVGPAEYPLMEVLRETIFSEAGHVSLAPLADDLEGRQDVFALIAHLEGNPIGFKIGYRFGPGVYYSKSSGVLKDYRRNGLGRRMQEWQHGWLRARGYRKVFFNSFNQFKDMIRFGLETGFILTGAERQQTGDLSFKVAKNLVLPDPPRRPRLPTGDVRVQLVGREAWGLIAAMASLGGDTVHEEQIETEASGPNAIALIVHLDSKPVGFALGRSGLDATYITKRFGVVDTYRDRGAEAALAGAVLEEARLTDHTLVRWNAAHDDIESIITALRASYDLTGLQHHCPTRHTSVVLEHPIAASPI